MQGVILTCFFGVVCAMGLWAAYSACTMRDELMRRGLLPPEGP